MKIVSWPLTFVLILGAYAPVHAEVLGVSPIGRAPVYFHQAHFIAAPACANHNQSVVVQHAPPGNLAPPPQQSDQQQQVLFAPATQYHQVSHYRPAAPTITHFPPPDAYWGQALTGRIMYFRPGHPLGNLLRAFGYNGPPLAP
jgi:hypothetical protein